MASGGSERFDERERAGKWREMTDEQFLGECEMEVFRGPGPGGQKRNKTSSSVRLRHRPTGITATAGESRSQASNRAAALQRLRHRVVSYFRLPLNAEGYRPPEWLEELLRERHRLSVSPKEAMYLPLLGLVLDCLESAQYSLSEAAGMLGTNTAGLSEFICSDQSLLERVNQERASRGLKPLRPRTG